MTAGVVRRGGGRGRGPFNLEEVSANRLLEGEGALWEAGRFGAVIRDLNGVAESPELEVVTEWGTDAERSLAGTLERTVLGASPPETGAARDASPPPRVSGCRTSCPAGSGPSGTA